MDSNKPLHIVMFPWLAMGHMYPCFDVSKILAQNGHFVTLISTPTIIDRLPKLPQTLSQFIKLTKLPLSPYIDTNHLPQHADSTSDIPSNKLYYLKLAYDSLQHSLSNILKTSNPDWIFYDFGASWVPQLARNLNIQCAYFSPCPAWSICFFDTPKEQMSDANIDDAIRTKAEDYYGPPKWIPFPTNIGLKPYEVTKLLEDVKVNETSGSPVFDLNKANSSCDMFVIRSSRDLEPEWLDFLSKFYNKPVIPVGLLPPDSSDHNSSNCCSDWLEIKAWLDTQKVSSVVYIAFGSEVKLSQENLNELALGIELSGLPFFWVLRKGSVEELPEGFEFRNKDHGIVWKTWAPQPRILGHDSVGGCLTHCGSGSMIENLYFGHVLVMLPFLLDQGLYSRVMEEKKVGIEILRNQQDGSFTRNSVAKALRLAMVDEEGSVYRKNAKEMGKKFSNKELHNQYLENFIFSLHSQTPNRKK